MSSIVEMKNVSVTKGGREILHDVTLSIDSGERGAVLGPNGSGKSSLIKTMTGEYRCDSSCGGSVKILSKELWNIFDVRKAFGIVSNELQEQFRRGMTAEDAVLSGFFGSLGTNRSQEITEEMRKNAESALELVCASHLKDRNLIMLSSGEMRRVIMARALVSRPAALILDEPMNALDISGKCLVRQSVKHLSESDGTIVMVTHDPADIGPEFERVIMIKDGKIFLDGSTAEITSGNLSRLYGIPIRVHRIGGRAVADY